MEIFKNIKVPYLAQTFWISLELVRDLYLTFNIMRKFQLISIIFFGS